MEIIEINELISDCERPSDLNILLNISYLSKWFDYILSDLGYSSTILFCFNERTNCYNLALKKGSDVQVIYAHKNLKNVYSHFSVLLDFYKSLK